VRLLTRRPQRIPAIVLTALLSAVFVFTATAVSVPSTALGASSFTTSCSGISLRTKATTLSTRKGVLSAGVNVNALAKVYGGKWRATCNGRVISGNTWYRINNIAGKSVSSRYGVTYVYAATGMFKHIAPTSRYAKCDNVSLRTYASTTASRKATLPEGARVSTVATVPGSSWQATCNGKSVSGTSWFRISYVNGTSVPSRYGVTYVYAASGLFTTTAPSSTTTTPTPTPTPTANPTPTPTPSTGPTLTEGIDVSHWQGTIDWNKVRASGKKFVYMKASENTSFVDNKYATNRAAAKAAGLLVGAYHFAQPGTGAGDAVAEADHFINTARPVRGELIPVLDLEVTNGLGSTALQSWTKSFLNRVYERTGIRAAIYVSPSFWSTKMGNSSWFANSGYKVLWVAHWTTSGTPSVPAENWGGYGWTFWQYTSDGTVPGISGRVDLNRYKGTDFSKVLVP
jgi:GH25 family lysozyme M1 (1,4-beta-N-acetylmuramidase)